MPTKPGVGAQPDTTNSLTTGLVGCWLFNEGAGIALTDISSLNQQTLSMLGVPTWTSGPDSGPALNFGTVGGDRVFTQNKIGFTSDAGPFTIAAQINATAGTSNVVFSVGEEFDSNGFISLCLFNGSLCQANDTSTGGINNQVTGPAVSLNTWHNVAISQTNGSTRSFMLDGAVTTNTAAMTGVIGTNSVLVFGSTFENTVIQPTWDYKGLLGYVMVWNRALSSAELAQIGTSPYDVLFGANTVTGAGSMTGPTTIQF